MVNQLRQSTASIPANVLEGYGSWNIKKRRHYLLIAKGSAWESWAHTDTLIDFGLVAERSAEPVRELQNQITALLISTVRRLEAEMTAGSGLKSERGALQLEE